SFFFLFFFFQAEDGIRDFHVTGVQTCALPILLKDALIVYGQNGEAIRPEQGYPLRLLLPGYEGNSHIKWLRGLQVSDKPFMTRRSEERRVGKECRSRWTPETREKKNEREQNDQ